MAAALAAAGLAPDTGAVAAADGVEEEEEEEERVEADTEVVAVEDFPADVVVYTGAEFTSTGSVEGIGLPSLVWSFTTFPRLTERGEGRGG